MWEVWGDTYNVDEWGNLEGPYTVLFSTHRDEKDAERVVEDYWGLAWVEYKDA